MSSWSEFCFGGGNFNISSIITSSAAATPETTNQISSPTVFLTSQSATSTSIAPNHRSPFMFTAAGQSVTGGSASAIPIISQSSTAATSPAFLISQSASSPVFLSSQSANSLVFMSGQSANSPPVFVGGQSANSPAFVSGQSANDKISQQRVCRYFSKSGFCLYGDSCQFLHVQFSGVGGGGDGHGSHCASPLITIVSPKFKTTTTTAVAVTEQSGGGNGSSCGLLSAVQQTKPEPPVVPVDSASKASTSDTLSQTSTSSTMSGAAATDNGQTPDSTTCGILNLPAGSRLQTYINRSRQKSAITVTNATIKVGESGTGAVADTATGLAESPPISRDNFETPVHQSSNQNGNSKNVSTTNGNNVLTTSLPRVISINGSNIPVSLRHQYVSGSTPFENSSTTMGNEPLIVASSYGSNRAYTANSKEFGLHLLGHHSFSTPSFHTNTSDYSSAHSDDNYLEHKSRKIIPISPLFGDFAQNSTTKSPVESSSLVVQEDYGGTCYFYTQNDDTTNSPPENSSFLSQCYVYTGDPYSNLTRNMQITGSAADAIKGVVNSGSAAQHSPYVTVDDLRAELLHRNLLCLEQIDPEQYPDLPQEIDYYHNIVPLESDSNNLKDQNLPKFGIGGEQTPFFNFVTSSYKATSAKDGLVYCLIRVHGLRLSNLRSFNVLDPWKRIQHSNIVQIREVFTTELFGDYSVIFVYDYFAGAETMKQRHFRRSSGTTTNNNGSSSLLLSQNSPMLNNGDLKNYWDSTPNRPPPPVHVNFITGVNTNTQLQQQQNGKTQQSFATFKGASSSSSTNVLLSESLIWCYIVQLTSALRSIHAAGVAARTVDMSKILIYGKSRLLLNCCGVFDVLTYEHNANMTSSNAVQAYQQEDLIGLGKLALALACNNLLIASSATTIAQQREFIQSHIDHVTRHYSLDLKNFILYLLGPSKHKTVNDVMPMIGARFYAQIDAAQLKIDLLETELTKELENDRLFKMLCKLNAVDRQSECDMESGDWARNGTDGYVLKLFRDYLFNQVDQDNKPCLDTAHVIQCLNKLYAGVPEKVVISAPDQPENLLVIAYADLRKCLEQSAAGF